MPNAPLRHMHVFVTKILGKPETAGGAHVAESAVEHYRVGALTPRQPREVATSV